MQGLARKFFSTAITASLLFYAVNSSAEINPFKKSKNYKFGTDVPWYKKSDSAMKSGSVKDGADIHYYHFNVDKSRILLRLSKNDPSGDLENTRYLDALAITDVSIDGARMARFDWCLDNQQRPGRKLKQNALVANDTCQNAGGGGDFIIKLDQATLDNLLNASQVEFVVEPYGRPVRLTYDMAGFSSVMKDVLRPAAKPKPRPVAKPVKAEPAAKPKPRPVAKPKPVKMCKASAPANMQSVVKPVLYPCDDKAKKQAAEANVNRAVEAHKQQLAEQKRREKEQAMLKQKAVEDSKREKEWDKKQDSMWISRCQRHWKKGRSPCYCEKYLDQAPPGVTSNCGN